jgi:hypothetical protein
MSMKHVDAVAGGVSPCPSFWRSSTARLLGDSDVLVPRRESEGRLPPPAIVLRTQQAPKPANNDYRQRSEAREGDHGQRNAYPDRPPGC